MRSLQEAEMKYRLCCAMGLFLGMGIASTSLCYSYGYHHRYWGGQKVIIINPNNPGYYNGYYNGYNPYYAPNPQYYYYPRYRCIVVPRCYSSGSCNYQNQECGYF